MIVPPSMSLLIASKNSSVLNHLLPLSLLSSSHGDCSFLNVVPFFPFVWRMGDELGVRAALGPLYIFHYLLIMLPLLHGSLASPQPTFL